MARQIHDRIRRRKRKKHRDHRRAVNLRIDFLDAMAEVGAQLARRASPGPLPGDDAFGTIVRRLRAGAEWIQTFSPALDRQRFVGFVRVGADLPAHRTSEQLPASAYRSICRGGGPRPPLTARIRRHHHVSAIGGASASRNRRFESVPLLRRVIQIRSWRQISTADKSRFRTKLG